MTTTYTDILVTRPEQGIALITLNRPEKRNALRAETFSDLGAALGELVPDPDVRAIVLTGAGDKAFSAGADLAAPPAGEVEVDGLLGRAQTLLTWAEEAGTPMIAALNGDAFGGGCEIALGCHFRVMARGARIGLTETNLGIMPAAGGTQRLVRAIGLARALDCIVFGKRIDAEQALAWGLVHRLADPGQALEEALTLARAIAKRPPLSVKGSIRAIYVGINTGSIREGERAEREGFARCATSSDMVEGISAFFGKREAVFEGR